jgi:hypothetical protein
MTVAALFGTKGVCRLCMTKPKLFPQTAPKKQTLQKSSRYSKVARSKWLQIRNPTFLPFAAPLLSIMASNTLLIEGSFEELAEEFAHYLDNLKKPDPGTLAAEIATSLESDAKDEVLKKLVTGASLLNKAPEKGMFNLTGF